MIHYDEAKELQQRFDVDATALSLEQCQQLDNYVKGFALQQLYLKLRSKKMDARLRAFIQGMVRCHYGSVEVDSLLQHLKCYPDFISGEEDAGDPRTRRWRRSV